MLPNYFHEIGKIPLLTAEEEQVLAAQVQGGCEAARNRMIAANLRLVVKIAAEFNNLGLPVGDLISEGNLGLIKAVERYHPDKGGRFSSYAAWWIRQSIQRALGEQNHAVRLTPLAVGKLAKLRRVAHGLSSELGREPTDDELAEELGVDPAGVGRLRGVGARPASMDALIAPDSGDTFGSLLVDESAEDPLEVLGLKDYGDEASMLLAALPPREREVIVWRFGLEGHRPMTLREIGHRVGRTRERVRQLQAQAFRRMRRALARRQTLTFGAPVAALPPPATAGPARRAA